MLAQAGLVARRGVLMQRALLDSLVERRYSRAVNLLGGCFVALGDGLAHVAQLGTQAGSVGAIARGAAVGLAGALLRRKMICHVWFVTFVSSERYSGGSEFLIIGVQRSTGQTVAHAVWKGNQPPRTRSCAKEVIGIPLCPFVTLVVNDLTRS